jgi:branched-chain amino acid transport system ATP-binding protein
MLMDEPAAACPRRGAPFAEVVRSVRDDHDAGVLLIDHNMALIMGVCDRIQVLDQGGRSPRARRSRSAGTSTSPPRTSGSAVHEDAV